MTRTVLTNLIPLGLTALLLSGCAGETSAPTATQDTNSNLHFEGPVWQGNVCMARTKRGKQVRVPPSRCPAKPAE
jgi:hypothetical protein